MERNEVVSWNDSRRFEARREAVKEMEDEFGIGRQLNLMYEQVIDLPFCVDNPDKLEYEYEETGHW